MSKVERPDWDALVAPYVVGTEDSFNEWFDKNIEPLNSRLGKKIKVMRASGHPIALEEIALYKQEWKDVFDKIWTRHKPDMLRVNKLLDRCEQILMRKYDRIAEWDMLVTEEQMKEKMNEYGNIMLTQGRDSGELLYVILDEDMVQG